MLHRILFVPVLSFAALLATSCQGAGEVGASTAQQVVESVAAKHPNVVRLTLHATPAGGTQLHAVGSTSAAKRGKPSDPEDVKAMESGQETVLQEGEDVDVTLPLADAAGKRTSVAGVTLRAAGRTREQVVAEARAIAGELGAAVHAAKTPLW